MAQEMVVGTENRVSSMSADNFAVDAEVEDELS